MAEAGKLYRGWSRDVARGREGKAPTGVLRCRPSDRIERYSPSGQDVYDAGELIGACAGLEPLALDRALSHLDRLTMPESLLGERVRGGHDPLPDFERERYVELLGAAIAERGGS